MPLPLVDALVCCQTQLPLRLDLVALELTLAILLVPLLRPFLDSAICSLKPDWCLCLLLPQTPSPRPQDLVLSVPQDSVYWASPLGLASLDPAV